MFYHLNLFVDAYLKFRLMFFLFRSLQLKVLLAAMALGRTVIGRSCWDALLCGKGIQNQNEIAVHQPMLSSPVVLCLSERFTERHQSLNACLVHLSKRKECKWELRSAADMPDTQQKSRRNLAKPIYSINDVSELAFFVRRFRRLTTSGVQIGSLFSC